MADQSRAFDTDWLSIQRVVGVVTPLDQTLWVVVLSASATDIALTLVGLELCFVEANPVARFVLHLFGPLGLVGLKGATIGVLLAVVRRVGYTYSLAALLGFAIPQLFAVGMNGMLLLTHGGRCLPT